MPPPPSALDGGETYFEQKEHVAKDDKKPSADHAKTVIVWDWDDTLLCSSYLASMGYRLDTDLVPPPELAQQLQELEASVTSVLTLAFMYGDVHIVTNAETGWVQLSAQKFMPGLVPLLERCQVLSARSTYETMFPESPLKWKYYAFQQKLSAVMSCDSSHKNIISLGDSHVEREAVRAATRGCPNTQTKSVKFVERPSIEQLRRQLELVTQCFHYIHHHEGDLDLALTISLSPEDDVQQKNQAQAAPLKQQEQTFVPKPVAAVN